MMEVSPVRRSTTLSLLGAALFALVLVPTPATAGTEGCTVVGTDGPDVFTAAMQTDGNDVVCGLGGDDLFHRSLGDDTYVGGEGSDRLTLADAPRPCPDCPGASVDFLNDDVWLDTEHDQIPDVEEVEGSAWPDQFFDHPEESNVMLGGGSRDWFQFGGVGDRIFGNSGRDVMLWWWSGRFVDPVLVSGDRGVDTIATYVSQHGVVIDLAEGTLVGPEVDADLVSIENASGTRYADILIGNAGDNRLRGGVGDDALHGDAGDDALLGGPQVDSAYGGGGTDVCEAETESACEA
jgi:Ca2+-binding RTX toxin-like protein